MNRITRKTKNGYIIPPELQEPATARLGQWEDMIESLEREYEEISLQLEDLRAAGKGKSVRFREQLARKLTVSTMLDTLRRSESQ